MPPIVIDAEYMRGVDGAKRAVKSVILSEKKAAGAFARLAWHDAGTFDKATRLGGPNGSIRIGREASHEANVGLTWAVELLEPVKSAYPSITYADLYQLAGVTALEMCGCPLINWLPGRKDSRACPPEGRLPGPNQTPLQVKEAFTRMGITDPKNVVLLLTTFSWANTVGHGGSDHVPMEGLWGANPLQLDNSYLASLLQAKGAKSPVDKLILEDAELRPVAEVYAKDESAFWSDLPSACKVLSELGQSLSAPPQGGGGPPVTSSSDGAGGDMAFSYASVGGALVAAGAAAVLAVWFDRRRRRLG